VRSAVAWEGAKRAWPGVEVAEPDFEAYLAERASDEAARAKLHANDLYLACACARSNPIAIALFIDRVLNRSLDHLRRMDPSGALGDDVGQLLAERLFVWIDGNPPRITDYSGRGPLASWVRVAALRTAHRLRGRDSEELDESSLASPGDLQTDYLKSRYREAFRQAFAAAMEKLPRRDRTVLRMSLIDGLSIDKVGRLHKVHRATAARWIESAREMLVTETRRQLSARLRVSDRELESLCGLFESRFSVGLSRL
jgi:RNA polymerase sigma-70 factor (ECF subfamily)